jgi:thioredoxin reductase
MEKLEKNIVDVLIVGGGPGGLSCALSIVRGGRKIIICDDNNPRNKNAECIRNLPGHEGINPLDYLKLLKKGFDNYPDADIKNNKVISIEKKENEFITILDNKEIILSKKVVIAEGVKDILPDIPGVRELWGTSVFHCAYCHGYENIGKEFGILVSNRKSVQMIRLLKGLTGNISIFTNGSDIFEEDELAEFRNLNMQIFAGKILSLKAENKKLTDIILENEESVKCDTLFIQNSVRPKSQLGVDLGCKLGDDGTYIVDEDGHSNIPGVYFAGDVGSKHHSVIMASAVGSHVGICVNADILKSTLGIQIALNPNYGDEQIANVH